MLVVDASVLARPDRPRRAAAAPSAAPAAAARCWQLRENLTVHEAAYVALAELFELVLVTADARLANTPGLRCELDLVGES